MKLALIQHRIKELLKSEWSPGPEDHPYFYDLKASPNLAILKEVAVWWRAFQLEQSCPLTSGYLKRIQRFDDLVEAFYLHQTVSPFIEEATAQFLSFVPLQNDLPSLAPRLCRFESALIKVGKGDTERYVFHWDQDPYDIFHYALGGEELPAKTAGSSFQTIISRDIANYFRVERMG